MLSVLAIVCNLKLFENILSYVTAIAWFLLV